MSLRDELARCDREIARCKLDAMRDDSPGGALLGLRDWFYERRVIMEQTKGTLNILSDRCHEANITWWTDIQTGEFKQRNVGELLMLCVSELAEAMEGHRKGLMDDKLPHRKMFEVELADCLIRIFDLAGALGIDLDGAFEEKMAYNAQRADHKVENRMKDGGKKY